METIISRFHVNFWGCMGVHGSVVAYSGPFHGSVMGELEFQYEGTKVGG